ncbi:MAG: YkgJ family cysteine cluster protein [Peptococcaceae bacterium]|nr:YkgJ family cysteine cluster protein [Peptococcaceae bacterium]
MSFRYQHNLEEKINEGILTEVNLDDSFNHVCSDECMGKCCHHITIALDPWDIESMARYLNISGQDFVNQYGRLEFDPMTRWPVVKLRHVEDGPCIFLLDDGRCRIYPVRSRNCRTYPVGRGVRIGDDGKIVEKYFIIDGLRHCINCRPDQPSTVRHWLQEAGAFKYYELCDIYLKVINYAVNELRCHYWMSPVTARMMMPLLYGPDLLRAKLGIEERQVGNEDFYRRRMKALKVILTDIAAQYGYGPGTGKNRDTNKTVMERMKEILTQPGDC